MPATLARFGGEWGQITRDENLGVTPWTGDHFQTATRAHSAFDVVGRFDFTGPSAAATSHVLAVLSRAVKAEPRKKWLLQPRVASAQTGLKGEIPLGFRLFVMA
jgi:hypothetical protein